VNLIQRILSELDSKDSKNFLFDTALKSTFLFGSVKFFLPNLILGLIFFPKMIL
jgi:hypothetical protein